MIPPAAVTVIVDGRIVASSQAPAIVAGSIVVPLDPYLRAIADRIAVDREHGTIILARGDRIVVITVGRRLARLGSTDAVPLPIAPYLRDGHGFVPLAALARALGAAATFDNVTKTLSVELPPPHPLMTPTPYQAAPGAPAQLPFRVDPTAAPRPTVGASPRPRRTPVEAIPSLPQRGA